MKKSYFNPEAMILVIADEDILTASPIQLSENLLGDEDFAAFDNMFKS